VLKEKVNVGVHIQVVTSYKLIKELVVNIEVENERLVEKNQNQNQNPNVEEEEKLRKDENVEDEQIF